MSQDSPARDPKPAAGGPRTGARAPTEWPASAKIVGATLNTMKILRHLARVERPVRVSYIARDTGIVTSTVFNILKTLALEGYVRAHPESKSYSLGPAVLGLAQASALDVNFLASVQPHMDEIARRYNVTVTLWQRVTLDKMMLRAAAESGSAVRIRMNVGHQLPMLIGGMGRIMALRSGLAQDEISEQFERLRKHRSISFEDFIAEAELAWERGWGLDDNQMTAGIAAVCAPVLLERDVVNWVASATMFHGQHSDETLANIGKDLMGLARQVAEVLPEHEIEAGKFV